jgi:general secretion pathway protein G
VALRRQHGFTLGETLLATALLAVGIDAVVARISAQLQQIQFEQAKQDVSRIGLEIEAYRARHHELPGSLTDLGSAPPLDPWGHPYEYVNFEARGTVGQRTFDGLPVNSEYDLYSRGPDGRTDVNLRSETARDDIVRARDGTYVGSAADF